MMRRLFLTAGISLGLWAAPGAAQAPPAADRTIVTVCEGDGPPQECRLVRMWTHDRGQRACQVQVLDTGEMLTVLETGPAEAEPGKKSANILIYHWGTRTTPPPGAPLPPESAPARRFPLISGISRPLSAAAEPSACPPSPATPRLLQALACLKDKLPCIHIHRYEKPPQVRFMPGACVPICPPHQAPSYGFYPTQWRPWPGTSPASEEEGPLMPESPPTARR